jgi:hypothetical protein
VLQGIRLARIYVAGNLNVFAVVFMGPGNVKEGVNYPDRVDRFSSYLDTFTGWNLHLPNSISVVGKRSVNNNRCTFVGGLRWRTANHEKQAASGCKWHFHV